MCIYNMENIGNIFEKGNKITTNILNCFEVIDSNDYQIVCKDLLTGDFEILTKNGHNFEIADIKTILIQSMRTIISETGISNDDRKHILDEMVVRISNWL